MKNGEKPKKGNPNRPRSKNNPNEVRKNPPYDYKKYEQKRKEEPTKYTKYMKIIAKRIRKLLNIPKGQYDIRVCAILALIVKMRRKLDYRSLSGYFKENSDEAKRCELRRLYGKSRLQQIVAEIDANVLQKIIAWIANTDANKEIHIDSSGFGLKIYTEWKHAKYGKMSVHKYIKLHLIRARGGRILACSITEGEESDSPQLRKLLKQIPEYRGGGDVYFLGDAAYNGKKNCKAIKASGRIPIITSKKGQSPKGFNAWSDMLRFLEEHPRTYYGILRRRNNIENTFSSLKARFGIMVSTKSLKTQTIDLLGMAICFNIIH